MERRNRVALVTGGKRIGAEVATALAAEGCDVAMVFRSSREEAEATAAAVRSIGRRAITLEADLSEPLECTRAVEAAASELGRLDILINMASVYRAVPFEKVTPALWHESLAVDLGATFACSQAAVPFMRRQGGGRIVNFTDWIAASGRPRYREYVPYYVAKAGVIALTEILALELASDRILVNAVAPGPIVAPPGTSQEQIERVVRATPLGKWGGAGEIAKAVLFLIETDFVTGETIRVDGGRHVK